MIIKASYSSEAMYVRDLGPWVLLLEMAVSENFTL